MAESNKPSYNKSYTQLGVPRGVGVTTFTRVVDSAAYLFTRDKDYPSITAVAKESGVREPVVARVVNSLEFKKRMIARGITWRGDGNFSNRLSPEQKYALQIVMEPQTRVAFDERLKRAGITRTKWNNWLRNPNFKSAFDHFSRELFNENMPHIDSALVERATQGDVNAAKLIYELSGRHDPAKQQMLDVQKTLRLILEVLTRRIADPLLLSQVAGDINNIIEGEVVTESEPLAIHYDEHGNLLSGSNHALSGAPNSGVPTLETKYEDDDSI